MSVDELMQLNKRVYNVCKFGGLCVLLALVTSLKASAQSVISIDDSVLLQEIVVTAQFVPTDVRETVNSVRILERKEIEHRAAVNLTDLLRTETQFRISHDMILGSTLSVNGMPTDNVKILVDGVPVIGRLGGGIDAGQLSMSAVRKVEIIEGAQSLLYGSSASAGMVNLLTRTHQLYKLEGEVTGFYESQGQRSLDAHAGIRTGNLTTMLSGGILQFETSPDSSARDQLWNPKDQKYGKVILTYAPREHLTLKAVASVFDEEVRNLGEMRRPQFKPYALDDYYYTDRSEVSLQGEGWLWGDYYWQATAAYNAFDRQKNAYRYEFENDAQALIEGEQDTSSASGLLLRSTFASNRHSRRWDFLTGAEIYRETLQDARIVDEMEDEEGFTAATELSGFGNMKFRIGPDLILQGGTRYTYHCTYGAAVTPSVWLAWRPKNWVAKASYANGFRSPGLKELYFSFIDLNHHITGNPDLSPEHSHNIRAEIGRTDKVDAWGIESTVSGFYNVVEDRIILAEISGVEYTYLNVATWRTGGGGIAFNLNRADALRLRTSFLLTGYFNTHSESEDIPALSYSPDWSNDLSISFLNSKCTWAVWHKWTGKTPYYYLLDDQEVQRGLRVGWHLLNSSLQFRPWGDHIVVTAGVKNILNVRETFSVASGGPIHGGSGVQPVHWGRTAFVQVRLALHSKS